MKLVRKLKPKDRRRLKKAIVQAYSTGERLRTINLGLHRSNYSLLVRLKHERDLLLNIASMKLIQFTAQTAKQ